jgi:hypothetical protein
MLQWMKLFRWTDRNFHLKTRKGYQNVHVRNKIFLINFGYNFSFIPGAALKII